MKYNEGIKYELVRCPRELTPPQGLHAVRQGYVELSYVTSGEGALIVRDCEVPCKAGDAFAFAPCVRRSFVSRSDGELVFRRILFDPTVWLDGDESCSDKPSFCYGLFGGDPSVACAVLNSSTVALIGSLFDALEDELKCERNEWKRVVKGYLSVLLIQVGRYLDTAIKNIHPVSAKDWSLVLSVMHSAEERYGDEELSLESIAKTLFVSKGYLSTLFKKLSGELFSDHLRRIRIEHSAQLLRNTDKDIGEIMQECGLRDNSTFYKNFKSITGMTPNEYRRVYNTTEDASAEYSKLIKGDKIMAIFAEISQNLQIGRAKLVKELVQKALDEGVKPAEILNEGLLAGMNIVGEKFKNNEVFVPEVLVAARAMNAGAQILKPYLVADGVAAVGKVCIGTVRGDLHDIGKNLVKMMMEGKGLEVIDLGTDVAPETFVQTAIEQECGVICCSALLTTTMGVMAEVVEAAEKAGIRDKVKIMIGGAPVNEEFRREIGADCYTVDAASAANAAADFFKA